MGKKPPFATHDLFVPHPLASGRIGDRRSGGVQEAIGSGARRRQAIGSEQGRRAGGDVDREGRRIGGAEEWTRTTAAALLTATAGDHRLSSSSLLPPFAFFRYPPQTLVFLHADTGVCHFS